MKKIAKLTGLFVCFFAASHAQVAKMPAQPFYDNNKTGSQVKPAVTPDLNKALLDKNSDNPNSTLQPDNLTKLHSNNKLHEESFSMQPYDVSDLSHGKYDIKKVSFPQPAGPAKNQ